MAEPADHTIRLLREMRSDIKERDESLNRKIDGLDSKVDSLDSKVDSGFAELKESIDSLAQALAGEMVTRRHTDAKVDVRLTALEKRVTKLERAR